MSRQHFSGHIDEDELQAFDEAFEVDAGRSRSDALRECLRLGTRVKDALDNTGLEFDEPREERFAVTEAISRMAYEELVEDV